MVCTYIITAWMTSQSLMFFDKVEETEVHDRVSWFRNVTTRHHVWHSLGSGMMT